MLCHNFINPPWPYNHNLQNLWEIWEWVCKIENKVIENYNTFGSWNYFRCSTVARSRWLLLLISVTDYVTHQLHHLLTAPGSFAFPCLITVLITQISPWWYFPKTAGPQKFISCKYTCNKFHFQAQVNSWAVIK